MTDLISHLTPHNLILFLYLSPPDHSMIMRSKAGIFKPKTYLVTLLSTPTEPTSVCQALPDPKWFQAIKEEYGSL